MNRVLGIVLGLVLLGSGVGTAASPSTPTFVLPACLQDQYGNQYQNLVQDYVHHIVTGSISSNQGCTSSAETMVGSWTQNASGQNILELTVATNTASCVPIYKLKGAYPASQWYYDNGYETNQHFRYATCSASSAVLPDTGVGGSYGVK